MNLVIAVRKREEDPGWPARSPLHVGFMEIRQIIVIHEVGGKVPVSGASLHLTGGELRDTAIPRLVVWATPCGGIWRLSKKAVTDEAAAFSLGHFVQDPVGHWSRERWQGDGETVS